MASPDHSPAEWPRVVIAAAGLAGAIVAMETRVRSVHMKESRFDSRQ